MDTPLSFPEDDKSLLSLSTVTEEDRIAIEALRSALRNGKISSASLMADLKSGCLTLMDQLDTAERATDNALCDAYCAFLSAIDHFLASPIYGKERTLLWSLGKEEQETFVEALMELLLTLRHLEPQLLAAESISIRAEAELPKALRNLARLRLSGELSFPEDDDPLRALPARLNKLRDDRSAADRLLHILLPSFYARVEGELSFSAESASIDLPSISAIQRITVAVRELRAQIYPLYTAKHPDR